MRNIKVKNLVEENTKSVRDINVTIEWKRATLLHFQQGLHSSLLGAILLHFQPGLHSLLSGGSTLALPARFSFSSSAWYTLTLQARPQFSPSRRIRSCNSSQVFILFSWGAHSCASSQAFILFTSLSSSESYPLAHDFVQRAHFKVIRSIWNMINYVSVVFQTTKIHFRIDDLWWIMGWPYFSRRAWIWKRIIIIINIIIIIITIITVIVIIIHCTITCVFDHQKRPGVTNCHW